MCGWPARRGAWPSWSCAQDLDVQLGKGTAELGHTLSGLRFLSCRAEHLVLVGVKGDGAAVGLQIGA